MLSTICDIDWWKIQHAVHDSTKCGRIVCEWYWSYIKKNFIWQPNYTVYASLCEEILSSTTNSKKLLFYSITLVTILQKVFLSLGKNEARSISTQSINNFCRTLNKTINRVRFQTVIRQIFYVLVTLLVFRIICLWLQHNG